MAGDGGRMQAGGAMRTRRWRLTAERGRSALRMRLRPIRLALGTAFSTSPDRLVLAPQDIRTCDPTVATDIYAGVFVFCGKVVDVQGRSPFDVEPPSLEWARALHGFGWLRHLRAADSTIARSNARALVDEWIGASARMAPVAWEPEVVCRRLMSWLSQAPLILDGCDREFYARFVKGLWKLTRVARAAFPELADGVPRLLGALALTAAGASIAGQERLMRQAARLLDHELGRQIFPDGGHVSRNPGALVEILVDLLPIREAVAARGQEPSAVMMRTIDRMMPMLRFFRFGDGTLAHFNGMGATPQGLLATILAYDDTFGTAPPNASHSGYQRLEAADTVAIVDVGPPPPPPVSSGAHAGCLSFELGSRHNLVVVNCGVAPGGGEWRRAARSTAAHSTAVIEGDDSVVFLGGRSQRGRPDAIVVEGPGPIAAHREDGPDISLVAAAHDGYVRRFGTVHERTLSLATSGERLDGIDRFLATETGPTADADRFALRFHLHPTAKASRSVGGDAAFVVFPDGESWIFNASGADVAIEESVFLATHQGPRRSSQIVVYGRATITPAIAWRFERQTAGRPAGRRR